jgi:hypothetical protein
MAVPTKDGMMSGYWAELYEIEASKSRMLNRPKPAVRNSALQGAPPKFEMEYQRREDVHRDSRPDPYNTDVNQNSRTSPRTMPPTASKESGAAEPLLAAFDLDVRVPPDGGRIAWTQVFASL